MKMRQKQFILEKINELENQNLSVCEADSMLTDTLIKAMPEEIQQAYRKMVAEMLPF